MFNKNLFKLIYLFLLFSGLQVSFAQPNNDIVVHKLTGKGNAPQSITYAVKQDSIGNLWIASEEGVLKFDSKKFKLYNPYNGLPSFVSSRVLQIFIDSKQRIWIGLEKGVCLYNKTYDRFDLIKINEKDNPARIKGVAEDDEHNIWFGGYNGLWVINDQMKFKHLLPGKNIFTILSYKNYILLSANDGFYAYNTETKALRKIRIENKQIVRSIVYINNQILAGTKTGKIYRINPNNFNTTLIDIATEINKPIFDIVTDAQNNYYVGTDGKGLFKFDKNFNLKKHIVADPNLTNTIKSNGIYDLEIGKEGIMWIATYGGGINYFYINPSPFVTIRHKINDPNSISANFVRAIQKDKTGKIWFGTKKDISIFDPETNKWEHILLKNKNNKFDRAIILSMQPDGDYMWVGTYGKGLYKINIHNYNQWRAEELNIRNIKLKKIYALLKDRRGNLWVGGIIKKLRVIRPDKKVNTYPVVDVRTLIETKNGNIIAGCLSGLYIITDSLQQFKFIKEILPGKKLAFPKVNAIYETQKGELILGTNGAGLIFFNPKTGYESAINMTKGLPSDVVQDILATNDQNLWISTTKGLAHIRIKPNDTIIHIYDQTDGLPTVEFIRGSFTKLSDELFAFGGVDGAIIFNPYDLSEKILSPVIVFDELKLSNKTVLPGEKPLKYHINATKEINLKHNQNSFEIRFTGILQDNPSQVKYSWKLEGFDQDWTPPSYTNFATYTNLNPGDYILKVKAFNKYGKSGPVREIKIHIDTPWWASNLAYFIYGLLILGLLFLVVKITSVVIHKKHAETQIDFFNDITHEIKTPMAVLLSSLESISSEKNLIDKDQARIKENVNHIRGLFEQMLNFQRFTSDNYFNEDIHKINVESLINNLLSNYKPIIEKRNLQIEINNQWGKESFYFNREYFEKILLNLISNAIKYSLDNGKITINIFKSGKKDLKIDVIDEGLGIPNDQQKYILNTYCRARNAINSQRPGTGLGLIMVKKLIDKTHSNIKFESKENQGTKFTVILKNFEHKYNENAIEHAEDVTKIKQNFEDLSDIDNYSYAKILIVEDNNELRKTLAKALSYYFQVFEAKNGKDGLEKVKQIHPDIILTDLIMPEMDGMEMAKIIKNDINLNHIPIFMLSVIHDPDQKQKSAETGISDYFEKPVNIKYLMTKILSTLKLKENLRKKYIHENNIDNAALYRNKQDQEFLNKLEKIILDNIENTDFSVHDLSEKMGMSRTSLYMKLKNLVDLSPQDFIIQAKLRLAKKLLIKGGMSIKEVAYSSGFSNPKYFSTVFKKFNDMSPRQFLESLK